ncbi:DNA ligase [Aeromonas phage PVN03]|uniref:DNA ligase n=1 Tax=Aeromonas phage PVN03 TaxID=2822864 RepID=A0AAE7UV17_9CAUD|nr:DNA ligase [Aeromonas phage PVN03]QTQ06827.1 DNA ligase [Aeromonas phage PVN03]QTQ06958.1 DNA ligase [Aeromonas phage PVN05]
MQKTSLGIAIQKALHLHLEEAKRSPKHLGVEYAIFEKYDGWYMYVDCIDGVWQGIRSKTGRKLPSMDRYDAILAAGPKPNQNIRLIFEAIIPGMIFKDLNGKFNQKKIALDGVVCMAHDVLFEKYPHTTFRKRYDRLGSVVSFLNYDWLRKAEILCTTDKTEVWYEVFHQVTSTLDAYGLPREGIIGKALDEPYHEGKRDSTLMKIKRDLTLDLLVVGMGRGLKGTKYENTLGYLIVEEKNGQQHQVSGMTDAQRAEWHANPAAIKGKIVEIEAMCRLPNGSLREARFKAVRHDKTIEDRD